LKTVPAAAALLALLLLIPGCGGTGGPAAGGSGAPAKDTLNAGVSISPETLQTLFTTSEAEVQFLGLAMDSLIETDPEGHDVPMLASRVPTLENGDIAKDGLTITYHLRHGVRWQDGAPFTSRDVAFTFSAIMNPNNRVTTRHGWDVVSRVDTPDALTAVFHLKHPFGPAVHTFFGPSDAVYFVLPEHLLGKLASLNNAPYNGLPIGTGAYRIVRWIRGDRVEYEANPNYFLGAPKIKHIVIHIIPDENTAANELKTRELDWFMLGTPRIFPQVRNLDGIDVRLVSLNANDAIIINVTRPPFTDARVRVATGLAIDKQGLVDKVTFGTTKAATEDLPSFMWAFDPTAGTDKQDLKKAGALLTAAGWRMDAAGVRMKNGKPLTVGLAFRSDSLTDRARSVMIASQLKAAGYDVELKGYQTALLYAGVADHGILSTGNYDMGLQTWYAGVDPDNSTQLLCTEVAPRGFNWSRYCNPQMDAQQAIALSHYDRATRKAAYSKIEHLLADDAPFIYLWWPRQIEVVNANLKNFRPNGIVEDWNAYQWTL
jgi:peptide/nickel transport system substrate-binding protein